MRFKLLEIMVLLAAASQGAERVHFETSFQETNLPCTTLQGHWDVAAEGLKGEPDSRIAFMIPGGAAMRDGKVTVTFVMPAHKKPLVPLKEDAVTCLCAFKILLGRTVAEVSDRWVRISRMDKGYGFVDSILLTGQFAPDPEMSEVVFSAAINNLVGSLSVNGTNVLSCRVSDYDFDRVELASYHMAFVVTSLKVSEYVKDAIIVDRAAGRVELTACYLPSHFNSGRGLADHHLMAWKGGRGGNAALFAVYVPDSAVGDSLSAAGARPGDNLTVDTWEKRADASSRAPDRKVEGSPVKVEVLAGGTAYPVEAFVKDLSGAPYDFRFGGNRALIGVWKTGCVVCLESCPAGRVSNRRYSIRDLYKNRAKFEAAFGSGLEEGDDVIVRFTVQGQKNPGSHRSRGKQ
jgi:hypothetical protein